MFRCSAFTFTVALAIFFSGCATTSVLIKSDDKTFSESRRRLQRTITYVDKSEASPEEQALFLQAESFYRYRFEPPARSNMSYIAEIAAAATDFPALQSFAGSLSLLDMRLRSSDSAVQLWETFLLEYPHSNLKALTLYRLGWAYRYTGAQGLPRKSSDEPFDELIKEKPGTMMATVAAAAKVVPWKSKSIASSRSLLPGSGQIYVGETNNGIVRLIVAAIAAAAIIYPISIASKRDRESNWSQDAPLLALGLSGLIVLSVDYTTSYEDAMRGVVQWNEKKETEFNLQHPDAP